MITHPDEFPSSKPVLIEDADEISNLERAVKKIETLDFNALKQEIFTGNNQPDLGIAARLQQVRAKLTNLLEGIDLLISLIQPIATYRNKLPVPTDYESQSDLSYADLFNFLRERHLSIQMTDEMFALWKEYKIRQLKWYQNRVTSINFTKEVGNAFDLWFQIMERIYKRIPTYGQDYAIDRNRARFHGDAASLQLAITNDWVKEIFVEAFPQRLQSAEELSHTWEEWLLKQISGDSAHPSMPTSGLQMKDVLGRDAQIHFVCIMPKSSPHFDVSSQTPSSTIKFKDPANSLPLHLLKKAFDRGYFNDQAMKKESICFCI